MAQVLAADATRRALRLLVAGTAMAIVERALRLGADARALRSIVHIEPAAAQEHADLIADLLVHAPQGDPTHTAETGPTA